MYLRMRMIRAFADLLGISIRFADENWVGKGELSGLSAKQHPPAEQLTSPSLEAAQAAG